MKPPTPRRQSARIPHARFLLLLAAALAWPATRVHAAAVPLTASDVALSVYATVGSSSLQLTANALAGFFGAHRCLCPNTISPTLQLTSSGQTNIGTSTVTVNFLLGANCQTTPSGCVSVGQATFTASQSALSPTFSSNLVFQAAAGSSGFNCASLAAGSTTLWAVITQDGAALSFAPTVNLPVITTTVAAPTLLYLKDAVNATGKKTGVYYLATEVYPHRYSDDPEGEWQVKVFAADSPDGDFQPVEGNPILRGQRACLFQHIFNDRFYGYDCHLETPDRWVLEEVEAPLP